MRGVEGQGSYYRGALEVLRFIESRRLTGRRFGADADSLWAAFHGDLGASARIDLLLRDADAEWPGAFGPRSIYSFTGVGEDEPFGAGWEPLDDVDAEELWRKVDKGGNPTSVAEAVQALAGAWGVDLQPIEVGRIDATDRLLVVGPSAIAGVIEAFAQGGDLNWAEQVTLLATPIAHRHLAAAGAALVNATGATRLIDREATPEMVSPTARLIASADADPADRLRADELVKR